MLSLLVIGYWLEKEFNFAVKEGCGETLENIKEGELIMVLMNSHLVLVTTNRLTTNFRSRFEHALNVQQNNIVIVESSIVDSEQVERADIIGFVFYREEYSTLFTESDYLSKEVEIQYFLETYKKLLC
ncbi:hypothetical protein DVH24_029365 [Malus domestica]|uniref:Uncharacterized protein n=1 Tax=Malus domestica TaxID=3750 RepID=A0A498HWW8_MALDO|nr:hypothetical protein DVH24_029365 [Malus domestica]